MIKKEQAATPLSLDNSTRLTEHILSKLPALGSSLFRYTCLAVAFVFLCYFVVVVFFTINFFLRRSFLGFEKGPVK